MRHVAIVCIWFLRLPSNHCHFAASIVRLQCQNGIMVPSSLSCRVFHCRHYIDVLTGFQVDTNENDDIVIRPTQRLYHDSRTFFLFRLYFCRCRVCLVCFCALTVVDARLPHYLRQIFSIASAEYIFYIIAHYISFCLSFRFVFCSSLSCVALPLCYSLQIVFVFFSGSSSYFVFHLMVFQWYVRFVMTMSNVD